MVDWVTPSLYATVCSLCTLRYKPMLCREIRVSLQRIICFDVNPYFDDFHMTLLTSKHTLATIHTDELVLCEGSRVSLPRILIPDLPSSEWSEVNKTAACLSSPAPPFSDNSRLKGRKKSVKILSVENIFCNIVHAELTRKGVGQKIDCTHFWESRFWNKSSCKSSDHLHLIFWQTWLGFTASGEDFYDFKQK